MLQTGVAHYRSKNSLQVLREATGTIYRSEKHISYAAALELERELSPNGTGDTIENDLEES
jgi:hypothetical protein